MVAITPASRRVSVTYSDFFKDLTISEINSDLARKIDETAIKESIRNLLLTDYGERLFQPEIGCNIRRLLFENLTADTIVIAKETIRNTITSYEPRCSIIGIDIIGSHETNEISIIITFNLINKEEPITLNITLEKVR